MHIFRTFASPSQALPPYCGLKTKTTWNFQRIPQFRKLYTNNMILILKKHIFKHTCTYCKGNAEPCSIFLFFKIGTHSGLLHCLSLVVTPPPQVRLQSVQCVHVDQLPSIGDGPFCPNSTHSPLLHHYNNVSICRFIKYWNAVSIYVMLYQLLISI